MTADLVLHAELHGKQLWIALAQARVLAQLVRLRKARLRDGRLDGHAELPYEGTDDPPEQVRWDEVG